MRKIIGKIFLYLALAFILFLVALFLLSRTQSFRDWVGKNVVAEINRTLNAELSIGRLRSNFFNYAVFEDIVISQNGDTVLSASAFVVRLHPGCLLFKEVIVSQIELSDPYVRLKQLPDSSWNIVRILKKDPEPDSAKSGWRITLPDIRIENGRFGINCLNDEPLMPDSLSELRLNLSAEYDRGIVRGKLTRLHLKARNPDLLIDDASLAFKVDSAYFSFEKITLRTQHSQIRGKVLYGKDAEPFGELMIHADPLDFAEMAVLIPKWPLQIAADIEMSASVQKDTVLFNVNATSAGQNVRVDGHVIEANDRQQFHIQVACHNLDPSTWLADPELSGELNGDISLEGSGLQLPSANWSCEGLLYRVRWQEYILDSLIIETHMANDTLAGTGKIKSRGGDLNMDFEIRDLLNPAAHLNADISHLNLGYWLPNDTARTDLNGSISADWTGFDRALMNGTIHCHLSNCSYAGIHLDTVFSDIMIKQASLDFRYFNVISDGVQVSGSGTVDPEGYWNLSFSGTVNDLFLFRTFAKADTLHGRGTFTGALQGPTGTLRLNCDYSLTSLQYDRWLAKSMNGFLKIDGLPDNYKGEVHAVLDDIGLEYAKVDSSVFQVTFDSTTVNLTNQAYLPDSISARVVAVITLDSTIVCSVPNMEIDTRHQSWWGGSDSTFIFIIDERYMFENFTLHTGEQSISVDGLFDLAGDEDLYLNFTNIALAPLMKQFAPDLKVTGRLDWFAHLGATAEQPTWESLLTVKGGTFAEISYDSLVVTSGMKDQQLSVNGILYYVNDQAIRLSCELPLRLSLTDSKYEILNNGPVLIRLFTRDMDMSFVSGFSEEYDFRGLLFCDLRIGNTLQNPYLSGNLVIQEGILANPYMDQPIRNISLVLSADSSHILVDKFHMQGGAGTFDGRGEVIFNRNDLTNIVRWADLRFQLSQFTAADNRDMTVVMDGNVNLLGNLDAPSFEGQMTVLRSRFYLPAFMESTTASADESQPILVKVHRDSLPAGGRKKVSVKQWEDFVDHLRGDIKLEIPRNSWLRSPEMNVEISGNVEVVKAGTDFEIFGTIRVLRGNYNLYGRRFGIQKGVLTFQGGLEMNPVIELEAQHIFRTSDRLKKTLKLVVSEKVLNPKLNFYLDNVLITETDAISYLIFGRGFDELTQSERSNLAQTQSAFQRSTFTKLLAGQIASQLARTLRSTLDLDLIEFRGDQNWRQAMIIVGKYITNELFLSYEREFNLGRSNEVVPEQVTLEYELTRSIFIRAKQGDEKTTGFDVIWKYER